MKFRNTTKIDTDFFKALFRWCRIEAGATTKRIKEVRLMYRKGGRSGFTGMAYRRGVLRISIPEPGRTKYPSIYQHGHYIGWQNDDIEALVHVATHEARHFYQREFEWRSMNNTGSIERDAEHCAMTTLAKFIDNRDALMAEWSQKPAAKPATPKLTAAEKREQQARRKFEEWERKLATAKRKRAEYAKKVSYYDKRAAAKSQ